MPNELDILIVEDDQDTRDNLSDILELDGHRVLVAESGVRAKEVVAEHGVSVILLDHCLPDATANELLPELNLLAPGAEIIVITGYADMDSTIAAFRHGAADYILKPVNPDVLRRSMDRIVQRRRIEIELHREQRFADVILKTAEAVVLVLDLDGAVVRFNPYFERISGWKLDALKGKDWFEECLPEKDRQWVRRVFLETSHEIDTSGIINPIITSDGRQRKIRWSNTTLRDENNRITAVLAVGVDVTELLKAQERYLQSERLATIGRTITGLAHESRNALQRIQAGLEMLELEMESVPDAQRDLQAIQRATTDLNNLLEEVRSYAAPIHLHYEDVSLPDVWRRVWRHLESDRKGRDVRLHESFSNCEWTIKLDVLRMEQVFRNLFENSLAACSDPVHISVSCVGLSGDPSREDTVSRDSIIHDDNGGDQIAILVQDNGPGLIGEQREMVFEPFFTTKSTGTGLGMAIVQRIVESHQGMIELGPFEEPDSALQSMAPGYHGGAQFLIRIPRRPVPRFDGRDGDFWPQREPA